MKHRPMLPCSMAGEPTVPGTILPPCTASNHTVRRSQARVDMLLCEAARMAALPVAADNPFGVYLRAWPEIRVGKSHKDILWTIHLAAGNGRFYFADRRDYTYISNPASITHRQDYYDIRATSYIDVIADTLTLSEQQQQRAVRRALVRHALVECRHFLGLYRRKVSNQQALRISFYARITFRQLLPGISSLSDVFSS